MFLFRKKKIAQRFEGVEFFCNARFYSNDEWLKGLLILTVEELIFVPRHKKCSEPVIWEFDEISRYDLLNSNGMFDSKIRFELNNKYDQVLWVKKEQKWSLHQKIIKKMNSINKQLVVGVLAFLPMLVMSQGQRLKFANKQYQEMAYFGAKEAYLDVLDRSGDSASIAHSIADCYDHLNEPKKVVEWLSFLDRSSTISKDELLLLGKRYRDVEDYTNSGLTLEKYKQKYGATTEVSELIDASSNFETLKKGLGLFDVSESKISGISSEMGLSYFDENRVLLSTSKRKKWAMNRKDAWNGGYFYELYTSDETADDLDNLKRLKGDVNTRFHDGPACYNPMTKTIYFTRNNRINGKTGKDEQGVVNLKLYSGSIENNKVSNVKELSVNGADFSTAHPTISLDGKWLYFSSDRPGGLGGSDIYRSAINADGSVGEPINMGSKINTAGNEYFPSFHTKELILFFASDGHFGLGGLDIYYAPLSTNQEAKSVTNIGSPINSSLDDFNFISNKQQTSGYFCSNRSSGKGSDDIYKFTQSSPLKSGANAKGVARDLLTSNPLVNTQIYLMSQGKIIDSLTTDESGNYDFSLTSITTDFQLSGSNPEYKTEIKEVEFKKETETYNQDLLLMPIIEYSLIGEVVDSKSNDKIQGVSVVLKEGGSSNLNYNLVTDGAGRFTTGTLKGKKFEDVLDMDILLKKEGYLSKTVKFSEVLKFKPELNVNDNISLKLEKINIGETDLAKVLNLNPIYFDLNSSVIRKDAAIELDKIYEVMIQNPTINIELGSHTDSRSSDKYNLWLSDRRAKSSAAYLVNKGISKSRITGKGYGESKLQISDSDIIKLSSLEEQEAAHQKNRRTEFIVVK